jgi:hypothetical protein
MRRDEHEEWLAQVPESLRRDPISSLIWGGGLAISNCHVDAATPQVS